MRPLLLCLLILGGAGPARAQGRIGATVVKTAADVTEWTVSFGFWNWTERMTLEDSAAEDVDWANVQANALGVAWRRLKPAWAYEIEGVFLAGQAAGGGNSTLLVYQQSRVNFSGFALKPAVFLRRQEVIEFGLAAPVILRNLAWPEPAPDLTVKSGSSPLTTAMAFWRLRVAENFLIEQGFGWAGDPSQSIWNIQAKVIF